jgi:Mg-chelatase subunit ChlD
MLLRNSILCCLLSVGTLVPIQAQRAMRLPSTINSAYEEREPTPSPDGRNLYFWRRGHPDNAGGDFDPGDIWVAPRQGKGWGPATRPGTPLNGKGHDFVWQVSPAGDTLWMMHTPPGIGEDGLSYSVRNPSGYWMPPRALHVERFHYQGTVKDFFLGPGRILFLTNTDTLRGHGGSDLYVAFPRNDTAWGRPISLGDVVNTAGNEDAPFLAPDGRALYFNSNGRGGFGDHDIYVSYRLDDSWRRWSEPVNLGPSVNTAGYDFDFFTSANGNTAYWASETQTMGSSDLFEMDINDCEVTLYPQGDTTLCAGAPLQLEGGYVRGRDLSYQWLRDGQPISGANDPVLITQASGAYQLVRWRYGCRDTSARTQVRFVDPPQAAITAPAPVLCLEGALLLRAQPEDANAYQWQVNGRDLPGATGPSYYANAPGDYTLRAAYGGCEALSDTLSVQRFDKPEITANTDAHGIIPVLPQWLWSNRISQPRGQTHIEALAANHKQQAFVLTSSLRGRELRDEITVFLKQGLIQGRFDAGTRDRDLPRMIAAAPNGDLIMADADRYLTRYTVSGRQRWSKQQSMPGLVGLAVDDLGYIYTAGWMDDNLRLDGELVPLPKRGGMFLARHDPEGELLWVKAFPIDGDDREFSPALHVDAQGNAYLAGSLELIANFGPPHVARATPGKRNFFLASFDAEGETRWATKFSVSRGQDAVKAVCTDSYGISYVGIGSSFWRVDPQGNIAWSGVLEGLKGESLADLRLSAARKDGYLYGLTKSGRYFLTKHNRLDRQTMIWELRASGKDDIHALALAADPGGHIYLSGLSSSQDLPGTRFDLTSNAEVFLAKYGPPDGSFQREPVDLCGHSDATLMTIDAPGLQYQWYFDGQPIRSANGPRLAITEPGTYQVRVRTPDCDRLSDPRLATACGQDPLAQTPTVVKEDQPMIDLQPESNPRPVAAPDRPTPSTDDPYSFEGVAENNLTLLLDVSASMNQPDKLPVLKEAFLALITHMRPEDQISIVSYAGGVKVLLSGVPATDLGRVNRAIEQLASSGGTRGKRGLKKAYQVAERNFTPGGNNRIIMATDGYFDVDELYGLADRIADDDINLSVFSFGKLFDRQVVELERLASRGQGNHENITRANVTEALLREAKAVRRQ